jgi:hypothetical protein
VEVAGGAVPDLPEIHGSRPALQLLQAHGDGDDGAFPARGRELRCPGSEREGFGERDALALFFVA